MIGAFSPFLIQTASMRDRIVALAMCRQFHVNFNSWKRFLTPLLNAIILSQLPRELVDWRLDDANGRLSSVDHPLNLFHGLRREELFPRVDVDPRRHVLNEEELAADL